MEDVSEVEMENAFEFAGYYLPNAFYALMKKKSKITQLGFYGGDTEKVTALDFHGLSYEEVLDVILANEHQALFACLIREDTPPADWDYPKTLVAEVFDFTSSLSGTIAVPYTPAKFWTPLKIHSPQVLGIQIKGKLNTNSVFEMVACFSLIHGVLKNPLYERTFTGSYDGLYLAEKFV